MKFSPAFVPVACLFLVSLGCQAPVKDAAPRVGKEKGFVEVFPHVWLYAPGRAVIVDGRVPVTVRGRHNPVVYLETVACTGGTKEHESLVVTEAAAAQVQGALLLLGLMPGKPGAVVEDGRGGYQRLQPRGEELQIRFLLTRAGREVSEDPRDWIINKKTGEHPAGSWVFAGSGFDETARPARYLADVEGTLIGLTTFGTETIAYNEVVSPESTIDQPTWIADPDTVPEQGTPVRILITTPTTPTTPTRELTNR